jgi:hypothetical protein
MTIKNQLQVLWVDIRLLKYNNEDYISLTDMLLSKDWDFFVSDWLRNKNTLEFLWIWEEMNNSDFNYGEFTIIKNNSWLNSFKISVKELIIRTNSIGIIARTGRYGWTYAHKDIAFEFWMWISPKFKLYLIKEFQRLKERESKSQDWNVKRFLTKMNYRIHTDAIRDNLIPKLLSPQEISFIYADEADMLNKILFGMTAQEWKILYPQREWNMRDDATLEQLIVLANMESINSELIKMNMIQKERISLLSHTAISQMQSLLGSGNIQLDRWVNIAWE